jgi:hypothetical protein
MIIDLELKQFAEIKSDLALELKIQTIPLSLRLCWT